MTTYTNTAASIWELVQAIAATSSKKEKENLVRQGMQLPLFERIVKACYDPLTTYGFRELPALNDIATSSWPGLDSHEPWAIIDALAARELTGDNARETVADWLNNMPNPDMQLFARIILKDMRAGFTEGTVNRVKPGTILEFPYMRCSLPDKSNMAKWDWAAGIISQEKADGMFVNVNVAPSGMANLFTRQGQPLPRDSYEELYAAVEQVLCTGTQTHGELLVFRDGAMLPREENNGVLNHLNSGGRLAPNEEVRLFAWDQVPLSALTRGEHTTPYKMRLGTLLGQIKAGASPLISYVDTRIAHSKADAMEHYREKLRAGKEGTVVKHPNAVWKDGTSKDQVKMKLEVDVDLEVVAIVPGKPHTKNEGRPGSLTVVSKCGQLQTDVTVKNEAMRDDVEANPHKWLNKIIKVRANSIMHADEPDEKHSLFLPRMVEATWRDDKAVADTYEQVVDQFAAAVESV